MFPRRGLASGPGPLTLASADTPPTIAGLTYLRPATAGKLADILLYQSLNQAKPLAIKSFHAPLSPDRVEALMATVEAWSDLGHPQVVRLFGAGVAGDGRPYIGMAYHPRGSLARALQHGPLRLTDIMRLGVQLADTLSTAHRAGLFHLNLKPANILLDNHGWPVLTDCGEAVRLACDPTGGSILPWSSPEVVWGGAPVDESADIYGLAATLWHLLTGRPPFELPREDNGPASLAQRLRESAPPPLTRPDVPAALSDLLQTSLDKEPKHRPATMLDFARTLRSIGQSAPRRESRATLLSRV